MFSYSGVCLYEFMCGGLPFGDNTEDTHHVCEEILSKPLKLPDWLKDTQTRRLITQLLSRSPEVRLGSSYAALKAHLWFNGFDWVK